MHQITFKNHVLSDNLLYAVKYFPGFYGKDLINAQNDMGDQSKAFDVVLSMYCAMVCAGESKWGAKVRAEGYGAVYDELVGELDRTDFQPLTDAINKMAQAEKQPKKAAAEE